MLKILGNSCLNALETMETSLEDGSVRSDKHEMRNALYTVDICRYLATVVDMEPVHTKLGCCLDCVRLRLSFPDSKAEHLKTLVLILLVHLLDVWEREPQSHTIETAEMLGMDWHHINNAGSVPTDIYGINGIPHLMLIGPDGTILKRGFHGLEGIQAAVAEYIK